MSVTPRRADRAISDEQAVALLDRGEYGVLATVGSDGLPYAVPMNYVRDGSTLILHSAHSGRKINNLQDENRISFCVVGKVRAVGEKFTTQYESVIVSGRVELIKENDRKVALLTKFANRFAPTVDPESFIGQYLSQTTVFIVNIETITGKSNLVFT